MNWQKKARLAIAVFVILFAAFVAATLRHRRPVAPTPVSPRIDKDALLETQGRATLQRTNAEGKILVSITAERQRVYGGGRTVFENAMLILPDRGGRSIEVTANEVEVLAPPGQQQQIGTAKLTGNVRLKTSDGIAVTAAEATYNETEGIVKVPGPVQFTRGRMRGSGIGATYDQNRNVLWLLDKAHVTVTADEEGGGAAEATAGAAGLARSDHYLRLTRDATITADARTLHGDEITARLTPDDERVQMMELRGNSRITGSGASGPQAMSANDIDLTYAADGRTLQSARLRQNAVVQLPSEAASAGRRISGTSVDMTMSPDGATVTDLTAIENVQVDLPGERDQPAKRIRANALKAGGAAGAGLQNASFSGSVDYRETRAAGRNGAAVSRTARAERLVVETKPGLGAVQTADFHGNVHFTDGAQTTAEAPRALYHVDRDQIDLSPSEGDPGPTPNVNDGKVSVEARMIELVIGTHKLKAETRVRSWMQPQKKEKGATSATKVPSMLKQDEQVNVTANRLDYDGDASLASYSGAANLWQGETTIKADTIVLDNKTGNLTARTKVSTLMLFDDVDPKTKQRKPTRTTATSDTLVYEDAKRLATYTGDAASKAHLVGPQGDLIGDRIELFLKADANELERAEGDGEVTVVETTRTAKGSHLTYTADDDRYVMTGTPVEVVETTPPSCKKHVGAVLTFKRSVASITIEGNGVYGQQSTPIACPAGRP